MFWGLLLTIFFTIFESIFCQFFFLLLHTRLYEPWLYVKDQRKEQPDLDLINQGIDIMAVTFTEKSS